MHFGFDLCRPQRRHLRPHRHAELLSGASHHHRRRRRRVYRRPVLARALESFRDWGRDCYCAPGRDNTCGKRFDWQLGELPCGYDHKYTYSHAGYNLKITDMQAALGLAQLKKLDEFIAARRATLPTLSEKLAPATEFLILPEATPDSDPSWFGFLLTCATQSLQPGRPVALPRPAQDRHAPAVRRQRHTPALHARGASSASPAPWTNADTITERSFWIGIYPGSTPDARLHRRQISEFLGVGT
jgi:CDP-6-deoxy-D-xylo-4-hexulose-3-dehydrase